MNDNTKTNPCDFQLPKPNFKLIWGDGKPGISIVYQFIVPKTWRNRLKWWLFCQFFPFTIGRWDKEQKKVDDSRL